MSRVQALKAQYERPLNSSYIHTYIYIYIYMYTHTHTYIHILYAYTHYINNIIFMKTVLHISFC